MPSNCGTDSHCKLPVLTPLQPSVGDVEDKQGVGHSVTSVHLVFFSWGGGGLDRDFIESASLLLYFLPSVLCTSNLQYYSSYPRCLRRKQEEGEDRRKGAGQGEGGEEGVQLWVTYLPCGMSFFFPLSVQRALRRITRNI